MAAMNTSAMPATASRFPPPPEAPAPAAVAVGAGRGASGHRAHGRIEALPAALTEGAAGWVDQATVPAWLSAHHRWRRDLVRLGILRLGRSLLRDWTLLRDWWLLRCRLRISIAAGALAVDGGPACDGGGPAGGGGEPAGGGGEPAGGGGGEPAAPRPAVPVAVVDRRLTALGGAAPGEIRAAVTAELVAGLVEEAAVGASDPLAHPGAPPDPDVASSLACDSRWTDGNLSDGHRAAGRRW